MYDATCGTSHPRTRPCPPSTLFTARCSCGAWHAAGEYQPCRCGQHGPNLYSCPPCVTGRSPLFTLRRR
jgi:hypothetical protein